MCPHCPASEIIEADVKAIQSASPNPVTHGTNLTYTFSAFNNNGPDISDGDTITDVLPSGTTFVSFSTTNGTCTHPAVGSGGTFNAQRSTFNFEIGACCFFEVARVSALVWSGLPLPALPFGSYLFSAKGAAS